MWDAVMQSYKLVLQHALRTTVHIIGQWQGAPSSHQFFFKLISSLVVTISFGASSTAMTSRGAPHLYGRWEWTRWHHKQYFRLEVNTNSFHDLKYIWPECGAVPKYRFWSISLQKLVLYYHTSINKIISDVKKATLLRKQLIKTYNFLSALLHNVCWRVKEKTVNLSIKSLMNPKQSHKHPTLTQKVVSEITS